MNNNCTIYVVRHGESVANRDEITGGNSELTEKGREQAKETKELLAAVRFDAAYSSDLVRARDTAAIIFGQPIPVENQLKDFRERAFGSLEDRPSKEWVAIKDPWEENYRSLPFEERSQYEYADDIESDKTLCDRFMSGLEKIAQKHPGQTVLVVSSAGPVRVMLMKLGFAPFLTMGSFRNAGYVELMSDKDGFKIKNIVGVTKPTDDDPGS